MTREGGAKDSRSLHVRIPVMFGENVYDSLPARCCERLTGHRDTVSELMRLRRISASASIRRIRTRRPNLTNGILRWHTHARIVLGLSRSKAAASGTVRSSLFILRLTAIQAFLDS